MKSTTQNTAPLNPTFLFLFTIHLTLAMLATQTSAFPILDAGTTQDSNTDLVSGETNAPETKGDKLVGAFFYCVIGIPMFFIACLVVMYLWRKRRGTQK